MSASATVTDTSLGGRVEPKEPPSVTALLEPALVPATLVTLWTTAGSESHVKSGLKRTVVWPTMGGRAASVSRAVKMKVDESSHAPE